MTKVTGLDHIAFAVPDLKQQVERFVREFGMEASSQSDRYAVVTDPVSGFKIELNQSDEGEARFRHLGFTTDDVDVAHDSLVDAGMEATEAPHRRDFARMYTSFLKEESGLEVQLVKYDE